MAHRDRERRARRLACIFALVTIALSFASLAFLKVGWLGPVFVAYILLSSFLLGAMGATWYIDRDRHR